MRYENTRPGSAAFNLSAEDRPTFLNTGAYADNSVFETKKMKAGSDAEFKRYLREFFHKEPCLYSHVVFHHASIVFEVLKHGPRETPGKKTKSARLREEQATPQPLPMDIPTIEFASENDKRLTFSLVFQTLKYQRFLEDMLNDCVFFSQYPEYKDDIALVMVILCDFQQRKFQLRRPLPGETLDNSILQIEEALFRCKTKLNAALARSRIKARVLSIDHLLDERVRQNDQIGSNMHVFCWVNNLKTNMNTVIETVKGMGFKQVQTEQKLMGRTYLLDHQCFDMIAFSYDQREFLETHMLTMEGHLVIQDKSSCVGVHSARALINEGDDILHINLGSGITTAHLASLCGNSDSIIHAFGTTGDKQYKQINRNLDLLGAKAQVKVFADDFLQVDHADERLKHVKVVLLTAECSRSGVANPVNFIVSEGEDMSILKDLSLGYTDEGKLGDLVVKHNTTLKHALRFPRVQAVIYTTRSLLEAENENVVTRAIEYVNMVQQKKTPFRIAPPVLPLSDRDIELENPLNGKYLRYPPSGFMSGCFVATITREADDPKEAAKDILARAAARGIITGVPVAQGSDPKKSKKQSGKKKNDKKSRKKSPARSPKRSKSTPIKEDKGGVSYIYKSMPNIAPSPQSATSMDWKQSLPVQSLPVRVQTFPMPMNGDVSQRLEPHAAISPQRLEPHEPPHKQVIKHPNPFR